MGLLELMTTNVPMFIIYLLAIVYGITIHEFSHCYTAYVFGDDSQIANKRLSLNPLRHIDPMGLIFLIFFGIGWGKTSVIDPTRLDKKRYKFALFMVSIAGILANFLSALFFALLLKLSAVYNWLQYDGFAGNFLATMIYINTALATFNLIPLYPLDGSKIVNILLPDKLNNVKKFLARYSNILLIVLLLLSSLFDFPINFLFEPTINLISKIFGI